MKSLKKIITLTLIITIALSTVFAASPTPTPDTDVAYNMVDRPYRKTSARMLSMGGAGIALRSNQDALYVNPASLGEKGLVWNMPNVATTIYNARELIATGIIDNYQNIASEPGKYAETILGIFGKAGNNKIATVDAGVGAKWGRFAFGVDTQVNLNTYTPSTSAIDVAVIPQVDVVLSTGLGLRFMRDSKINFDIGAAVRLNARGYYEKLDANYVLSNLNNMNEILKKLQETQPMVFLYSMPIDFGFNLNLPAGMTLSTVVRNINGSFKGDVTTLKNASSEAEKLIKSDKIKLDCPMSVDFGFGWKPYWGLSWLANPNIAVDVVDVVGLTKEFSTTNLLAHMRAGIEVEILKLLELRAGLNQGYVSIGAGFNLMNIIHLEASYYRLEFGEKLLDKPVDALTVRMNIFWER